MIYLQQLLVVICFKHWPAWRAGKRAVERNVVDVSDNETCFWMLCKTRQMSLGCIRRQPVIGIEKKNVFSTAGLETRVTRPGQSSILLSHVFNTGMPCHHRRRVIA